MRYEYLVTLRRESEKATDLLSLLLCLLSIFSFFYYSAGPILGGGNPGGDSYFLFIIGVILTAGIIYYFFSRRRGISMRFRFLLLLAALGWLATPILPWLGVFFFILTFLEYQTKRPLEIGFDKDIIVFNTLIRRRYVWTDFSNVVLKDGLLTLDFANNRLFQKEVVDDDEGEDASEEEFNAYCRERLAAVGR